jgi:methylthioribulose-1-phosphate dehydratase
VISVDTIDLSSTVKALSTSARSFYRRGWVLGTSGNFSAVLSREPLRLAISASGMHKGALTPDDFLIVDEHGVLLSGRGKPSAETLLHVAIANLTQASAVLHTHSVWGTMLSDFCAAGGGVELQGYEMLKGLAGVTTHEHRESIPVLENNQDYLALASEAGNLLLDSPKIHGFLLRRHGLYTWGRDVSEGKRHVEILEFLFEVEARLRVKDGR